MGPAGRGGNDDPDLEPLVRRACAADERRCRRGLRGPARIRHAGSHPGRPRVARARPGAARGVRGRQGDGQPGAGGERGPALAARRAGGAARAGRGAAGDAGGCGRRRAVRCADRARIDAHRRASGRAIRRSRQPTDKLSDFSGLACMAGAQARAAWPGCGFLVRPRPGSYKPAVRGPDTPGGTPRASQTAKTRRISTMATVNELKATARPKAGKGAARTVRREGRVPGVIYGDNKAPVSISLDFKELRHKIYAGHFLTTVFNVDVDGTKHRVIPRDFQLDPVKDNPLHVDFLRLGEGAQVRVRVPIHVKNADQAPGIKRGGTVNIVTHTISVLVPADDIPQAFDVDLTGLEINYSKHLSDVQLPSNVKVLEHGDITLVTIVPPPASPQELKRA